jgi:hypothetical protein
MSKVVIKGFRGLQTIKQLKAHAKYVGENSKQLADHEKGAFFSRDEDKADIKQFIKRVEKHPSLQHSLSIKVQKMVLSLTEEDYEAYKRSGLDFKDVVRQTLHDYEQKHQVKLDWVANIHAENDAKRHPHCHLIIKGVSDIKGERGFNRIKFTREDYKDLRQAFSEEIDRNARYTFLERIDFKDVLKDMTKSFEGVMQSVDQDLKKREWENEAAKDKEMNKKNKDKQRGR